MSTWILTGLASLVILINALLGLRRGTVRSLVRLILLVASIPLAVWLTRLLSGQLEKVTVPLLNQMLAEAGTEMTDALTEATHALEALAAMLTAALSFTGTYLFVCLLTKLADKPLAKLLEKHVHVKLSSRLAGLLIGILAGAVMTIGMLSPFTGLLPMANSIVDLVGEPAAAVQTELNALTASPVRRTISTLGGDAIFSAVTTVNYKDEKVNLNDEAAAVTGLARGYVLLSQQPAAQWGEEQILQINEAADAFDGSHLTADLAASLLRDVSAAWKDGEPYMGIPVPSFGELLDPAIHSLLVAFASSTEDTVRTNVHTAAKVLGAMIRHDVFDKLQSNKDSTAPTEKNDLIVLTIFSDTDFTGSLVNALYEDRQLRVLIPEILNIGVRAVALSLGIPDTYEALYQDLLTQCTDAINGTAEQGDISRMVDLGDSLYDIFRDGGVSLSPSTATALAMGMIADLGGQSDITTEDIRSWFTDYAAAEAEAKAESPDPVAMTDTAPTLCPLDIFTQTPTLILLGNDDAQISYAGASAAAAYIAAMQNAPTPHQVITVCHGESDAQYRIVSMSDGTLRCFDAENEEVNLQALALGTVSAPVGGEFVAIRLQDGWELLSDPARIDSVQLRALGDALVGDLSPLPAGYVPHRSDAETIVQSNRLQNAQNVREDITDTASLLNAVRTAANHELANGTYSTGSVATMGAADTFKSDLPCLDSMLLSDIDRICDDMSAESAGSVADAISTLATYLDTNGVDQGALFNGLFSTEGAQTVSTLLNSLTQVSGDSTAATNTLLAGISSRGGDIGALRALLNEGSVDVSNVASELLTTSGALTALTDAANPEEQIDAIESILSTLTEDGARAIAAAATPTMLERVGVPHAHAQAFSSMVASAFTTLADAKHNGMTEEQFRREANALTSLFSTGIRVSNNGVSDRLFGQDGTLGKSASELMDTVLSSNVISDALIDMVGGSRGAYFSVAYPNPLGISGLSDADTAELQAAIRAAEQELQQLPPSNGELWTPQNNHVTRQDTARRILAFATLFGLEHTNPSANIAH